jgi:hypothetical protein
MHLCHQKPNPTRETVPVRTDPISVKFYFLFTIGDYIYLSIDHIRQCHLKTSSRKINLIFLLCLQRETESHVPLPELEEEGMDLPPAKPNPPATRQNGAASKNKKKNQ